MAWRTGDGGRQFRKDASAAKRAETERAALVEPTTGHRRKSVPNYKKKFGIESRYVGPGYGIGIRLLEPRREWHIHYSGWYEKARDRDNAIVGLNKNSSWLGVARYEYRPIDR